MSFFCIPRISDSCNCLAYSGFVWCGEKDLKKRIKRFGFKVESVYLCSRFRG